MPEHVIKRGLDIPIAGAASGEPVQLDLPGTVAYSPQEFRGLIPKLSAREGDSVKKGSPLFHSKLSPELKFLSPVSGTVKEVRRGRRRVITDIVIERGGDDELEFQSFEPGQLPKLSREDAREHLLLGGLWGILRTRPLDNVADPAGTPQSIVVNGHETGPLMPDASVLLAESDREALQAGIHVLKALTDGPVFLTKGPAPHKALEGLDGCTLHTFRGPHPAGDAGVQVNLIDPPRHGGSVWYASAWDVVLVGKLFLTGRFPAERIYAAVGTGCSQPRYVKTLLGAPLSDIVGTAVDRPLRWIRGSVLTGEHVDPGRWATFYKRAVHLLPDRVDQLLFGWALPSLGQYSFHKAFLTGFTGVSKPIDFGTTLWGGHRAMVPIGAYERVVPSPDLLPEFLFKAIVGGDLEEAIKLGLLDITMEEAALCTYICPSKIGFDKLLREGLDLYQQEI